MQNKGFVKVFAMALTLVCLFYLSFSVVTYRIGKKADKYAMVDGSVDQTKREHFIDSISKGTVWLWYDYKSCQKQEINLGLDLKGGMNAILQVEVADVLKQLSEDNQDAGFKTAIAEASKEQNHSQEDYVSLFMKHYNKQADKKPLAAIFATAKLRGVVTAKSTDAEVEKVLRDRVEDAVNNSFNVLRTRIDRFGVTQPRIQKLENKMGRIMVELPGVKDPERVRKLLQGSANLQFWTTYTQDLQAIAPFVNAAAQVAAEKANQSAAADTAKVEADAPATDDLKSKLAAETTEESVASQVASQDMRVAQMMAMFARQANSGRGPILGYVAKQDTALVMDCFRKSTVDAPKALALHWGVKAEKDRNGDPMGFALYAIKSSKSNRMLPALEGDVVTDARDEFDQRTSEPVVSMTMNTQGAKKWAKVTKDNINKCVAIVLDGTVYSAPNVNTEITGGSSQISGSFTPEEAKDLANVLKSGRMPAPAKIVSDDIVGPSLGAASIRAGFISFVVALVLLMIYMCMMYGLVPGMIANAALILNFFFTLGILASFQAALTMSGIAGMVLTLGMAVDANVLIYERTKEELRGGKGVKLALTDGYKNALSAIFDSNLTSIITGIILFNFGTGPIRGFATTLIIGIICSFFTAVFMTRLVYEHFMAKDKMLNLTFTSAFSKNMMVDSKFNFMGNAKKSFAVFGVLIVVALGFLFTRGMSQSIDFTGGRNYKVVFDQKVVPENIEKLVKAEIKTVAAADETKSADATVSVIALGGDGQTVRVSTNFDIENNSTEADNQMEAIIFKALKSKLAPSTTLEDFQNRDTAVGGSIVSSQKVGPTIAEDIKVSAVWSVVLSLLAIALYILFRFRNISYSVGSVLALTSDTLLIMGIYAIGWGWLPFSLEVDQTFIGAILTAIGYSINDKVVIFDRIREFFGLYPKHDKIQVFNDSLNTTLARTISTSVSTLIVLVCIFILGGDSIRSFSFAMILGVVIGTLSSLFLAAPIAYTMQKGMEKKA